MALTFVVRIFVQISPCVGLVDLNYSYIVVLGHVAPGPNFGKVDI